MAWGKSHGSIKFDPNDFFVPPSVDKGHSQQISVQIQARHYRALVEAASSGFFSWTTPQDAARWAIAFGLEHLARIASDIPGLTSTMRQAYFLLEEDRRVAEEQRFEEVIAGTKERMRFFEEKGQHDLARLHINNQWRHILAMPQDTELEQIWKKRYMDAFESRWKELIDYDSHRDNVA